MKENIIIRPYQTKDCEQVRDICLATADGPWESEQMRELLLSAFCNYYIEKEPYNCFVAADGERCAGYILCAQNNDVWAQEIKQKYMPGEGNPLQVFYEGILSAPLKYACRYPAHLHIDILPAYQRLGIGFRLMDSLVSHLRQKNIPGLMLCVAVDNGKGQSFYRKYGFETLETSPQEIVMGMELKAN